MNFKKKNVKISKTYEDIILENEKLKGDYDALMARDDHVVNENEKYKRRIKDLELIININQKDKNDYKSLEEKFNKLSNDFNNLQNEYNNLKESNKKLISVIFISTNQAIHCSIICKSDDSFSNIENSLYEEYPEYKNKNNIFTANGNQINKNLTLSENNITNNSVITLNNIN